MKNIYYKGRGEHSVRTLEEIIDQRQEEIRQLKLASQGQMTIEKAKEVLKDAGYYVENLWQVNDVLRQTTTPDLSDSECFDILDVAINAESVAETINNAIIEELEKDGHEINID